MATSVLKQRYCLLPAQFTGDLWHMAAASILSKKYGNEVGNLEFVTVMIVCKGALGDVQRPESMSDPEWNSHLEEFDKQRVHGAATFNYLTAVGAKVMFLVVDTIPKEATKSDNCILSTGNALEWYMHKFSADEHELDRLYLLFESFRKKSKTSDYKLLLEAFTRAIKSSMPGNVSDELDLILKVNFNITSQKGTYRVEPSEKARVLRYYASTTVAMKLLEVDNEGEKRSRMTFLRDEMSGGQSAAGKNAKKAGIKLAEDLIAMAKSQPMRELKGWQAMPDEDRRPTGKIIIFNWREGKANKQTNNAYSNFVDFTRLLETTTYRIVVINGAQQQIDDMVGGYPVFDLFLKKENAPFPGREPLVTNAFWAAIADNPDIIGVFSGRTGSLDVAAFNGVNCLWWDMPWIHLAAQDPTWTGLWTKELKIPGNPRYLNKTLADLDKISQNVRWVLNANEKLPKEQKKIIPADEFAASTIYRKEDQLSQCLRCLQLANISKVFFIIPQRGLKDQDELIMNWIESSDVDLSILKAPIISYNPMANWLYWKEKNEPYTLSYYLKHIEYSKGSCCNILQALGYTGN